MLEQCDFFIARFSDETALEHPSSMPLKFLDSVSLRKNPVSEKSLIDVAMSLRLVIVFMHELFLSMTLLTRAFLCKISNTHKNDRS